MILDATTGALSDMDTLGRVGKLVNSSILAVVLWTFLQRLQLF